jgi:diguanylate cyclase
LLGQGLFWGQGLFLGQGLADGNWSPWIGLAVGLCLLGASFALGLWLGRRPAVGVDDSVQAREVLQHLSQLAAGMEGDYSNYQRLMHSVAAEVERMGETSDTSALRQMLDELNVRNRDLKTKLSVMQAELDGKAQEVQTLVSESRTDALTGLPNRRCFNENIEQRTKELGRYGGELSFVILDVDHFKKFNDTYGHLLGDEVLRKVAQVMQATVRDSDIPVRLGGEEFAVLMPAVGLLEAGRGAERLRQAIEQCRIEYEGKSLKVTASFGVTQVAAGDHAETVVERADQALYAAKEASRNAVWLWENNQCRPLIKSKSGVPHGMKATAESLRESLLAAIDPS